MALPQLVDVNDVNQDKLLAEQKKTFETVSKSDKEITSGFEHQLGQALRNAVQGELGRALAVSKLEEIKGSVN